MAAQGGSAALVQAQLMRERMAAVVEVSGPARTRLACEIT